jgi:hypothetical protein
MIRPSRRNTFIRVFSGLRIGAIIPASTAGE